MDAGGWFALGLVGYAGLAILRITYLCEGLHILFWMRWGSEGSLSHYLNLASLATGLLLIPTGYVLTKRSADG